MFNGKMVAGIGQDSSLRRCWECGDDWNNEMVIGMMRW